MAPKVAFMPLAALTPVTAGSKYCVRAKVEPVRTAGKDGSFVMNGTLFDASGRYDFSKWSASPDDFKDIVDGGCYVLTKPVLERLSADEALWSTSPSRTKIKITKTTLLTAMDPPPDNLPQYPMQPTLELGKLLQRLQDANISGHKIAHIDGEDKNQARFLLVDISGTIMSVEAIKPQRDGFSYDCTLASGDSELILTVWTHSKTPEVSAKDEVFIEKIKVSRPSGDIVASVSLTARNAAGDAQSSRTTGRIRVLAAGTLRKPAAQRTALNEAWQKTDCKELPADVCCLKNIHSILQQIPSKVEGADVHVLECRGVWVTELHGADKWFTPRCEKCRKTENCACGVGKKPGCFGGLTIMDATGSIRATVGDTDDGSVAREVLCVRNLDRLPTIFDSDPGSLLLKNRLHLRLRVAPYDSFKGGLKTGARIICATSDLYGDKTLAEEFGDPLDFESDTPTINELFYGDLPKFASGAGSSAVGICLATNVADAKSNKNASTSLHEMTGKAMVLDASGTSQPVNVYGVDGVEAGATRFALVKGKSYIMIFHHVADEAGDLTLHLQRGLLVKKEDLENVKTNFAAAARRALHEGTASGASSSAPTTFMDLAKAGTPSPRKRTAHFATLGEDVDPAVPYTTMMKAKQPKTK
jgi:hypothetical protein